MSLRSLSMIIHGEPGTGKTRLGSTTPAPRLIMDIEGGSRFLPVRKVIWDPMTQAPPVDDGTWDTCIVYVRNYKVIKQTYDWLAAGKHPFRSVIIDSLTEAQKRLIDDVSGTDQPTQQNWGAILRTLEDFVRKLRDLTFHETFPLETVVVICLSHMRDGKFRPFVKGQLELSLPGFVDVVGYLYVEATPEGEQERKLLISPLGQFDAKDRTGLLTDKYGSVIVNPNMSEILATIFPEGTPA